MSTYSNKLSIAGSGTPAQNVTLEKLSEILERGELSIAKIDVNSDLEILHFTLQRKTRLLKEFAGQQSSKCPCCQR